MAAIQEPEVQFAQRLASNEKPIRTKAIKKLRKYINVRSQKASGGFTGDELLKLWKGLFYCLWMQDKPLLQEELSNQISSLIHSFQDIDGQFLYLESFLQTVKREWTGIDRLRMDKFFQLVRFMFRQTFETLKRTSWDSSVVSRFLELLTAQLLRGGCDAPSGLQFHVLDLYLTELAAVGSAELTADQNLIFIEPFCRTAAKTKDRTLFRAVCSSIFSTIIDQAPFAIEDLMKEVETAAASDSDSGQASEGDEDEDRTEEKTVGRPGRKAAAKQVNGSKSSREDEDEDEDDDEELHLEDSDSEAPCDEDVGPVLQFDYASLADKLFAFASRSSTPSQNRQRLYKIIKVLRDLSEGVFPQDEYPEEVSTDEDDDMFASRKRMKRRQGGMEEGEEGAPASKKSKGNKKEASKPPEQNENEAEDDSEAAELTANNENKKKKKKKKRKKKRAGQGGGENAESSEQEQTPTEETEGSPQEAQTQSSGAPDQPSVTEEASRATPGTADGEEASAESSEKKSETPELEAAAEQQTVTTEPEMSADATAAGKKKKRKRKKALKLQTGAAVSQVSAEAQSTAVSSEASTAETTTDGKKKKKKAERKLEGEPVLNGESREEEESTAAATKKGKKKNLKADEAAEVEAEGEHADADITSVSKEASLDATTAPLKKKTKNKVKQENAALEASDESAAAPPRTKRKKNQKESDTMTPVKKKKKKKLAAAQVDDINDETQEQATSGEDQAEVSSSSRKPAKKKRKIPVVFEFEAEELEAAASVNGLAEEETRVPSTPLSAKKTPKTVKTPAGAASDFITFQSNAAVPTALFCKSRGSPSTPLSRRKQSQTPSSESKKVTFGLKNNKTAEFKKTDRSLLVSPDGSSRVPFDPKQKPKFGVLKSPATSLSSRVKKTPDSSRKTSSGTPKSAAKRRPAAADFF
ncbi:ribosomal RNA processing protein 1 homolog B-like [Chaetodon trifascialis]|uniref:ribosomal RNA processing protein 1 homolog B-like n=1 Tax=Chaetodon trifascialis TaxID=109706 RepID=UPI0039967854